MRRSRVVARGRLIASRFHSRVRLFVYLRLPCLAVEIWAGRSLFVGEWFLGFGCCDCCIVRCCATEWVCEWVCEWGGWFSCRCATARALRAVLMRCCLSDTSGLSHTRSLCSCRLRRCKGFDMILLECRESCERVSERVSEGVVIVGQGKRFVFGIWHLVLDCQRSLGFTVSLLQIPLLLRPRVWH